MKNEQKKLYQVFQLIRLLNTPPAKDVAQLARRLGIGKSSIYEYIKLLKNLGYKIETDDQHRKSFGFDFSKKENSVLESDELNYLQELLQQAGNRSLLAKQLLHKFNLNLSLIPLADALPQLHNSRIVQLIRAGLNSSRCLKLYRYRSLTSNTVEDRLVEPLELTPDFRYLIAWDLDKKGQRQFKIDRIEDVDLLDQTITPGRFCSPMDLFGLTGDQWLQVRLRLSATAHHLMIEEFPLSRPYIRKAGEHIIFDGQVRHWKGIGRFVLGLPGEVEVLGPAEFLVYLEEKGDKKLPFRK